MSDNLPWKTWTPDDLAPPQAEFVPMVEPEETIIEEAEPSLEQQLAQLQMQAMSKVIRRVLPKVASKVISRAIRKDWPRGWSKVWQRRSLNKRQFMPGCSNWSANFKLPLMHLIV
ncbi:flagellar assembly protein H [Escherichia coli]|nr:flagellar assembly protein H [Escherichia coli]